MKNDDWNQERKWSVEADLRVAWVAELRDEDFEVAIASILGNQWKA